jgi:cytoskeletal protein CcmA (bactofilin family)
MGDVEVRGTVEGDVVVVGGSLRIMDGGEITGDVRLADSRLSRDGGNIRGEVTTVTAAELR